MIDYPICEKTGKMCLSEKQAGTMINKSKTCWSRGRNGKKNKTPKRKYYCDYCKCYHLTSMKFYKAGTREYKSRKTHRIIVDDKWIQ